MRSSRVWLFRSLVAVIASMMVTSFTMPWWIANLSGVATEDTVITITLRIYAYGFYPAEFPFPFVGSLLAEDVTPFYQTVFAWIYIAASVGLILYSTWLKGRKGRWLLGGTGLVYIAYAAIAVIWIAIRTGYFDLPLQGSSSIIQLDTQFSVEANLPFGYYLAHTSGLMCIALALLRNKIVGKPKLVT